MKTNSTRSNGPRELDRRTKEGRAFFARIGKSGFAKARRTFKKTGTLTAHMSAPKAPKTVVRTLPTPQVDHTVKPKLFNWGGPVGPTLSQIDADIAYREEVLTKIKGLRDIVASMEAKVMAIAGVG